MNYTLRFIVLPVLIVGLIAFILIFVTRSVVKYEVESANDTTREIVNGVLEIHRGNLIRLVMDYAHWDDAVTMIFVEPDKEQTEVNFLSTHIRFPRALSWTGTAGCCSRG